MIFMINDVTSKFNNVVERCRVYYDNSSMEYKVTRIINKDEYCWLYTQDKNVVQNFLESEVFYEIRRYS